MSKKDNHVICPVCSKGEFREYHDGRFSFKHGKKTYVLEGQAYARCNVCEVKGFLPGQRASNHLALTEFQKNLHDYVSPSDVLAVRERYSLTQNQATQIFKGGVNGFSKWERGVTFPSGATAMLIKAALKSAESMRTFADIAQVDFPIIDQMEITTPPDSEFKPIVPVIFVATHEEYCEEVVTGNYDNESEIESETSWATVNTGSTKSTSFLN